jgi:hypothetical protein
MIKRDFNRITEVGKVNAGFPFRKKWPKFLKALSLFVPRKMVSKITAVQQDDTIGDIVLHIP